MGLITKEVEVKLVAQNIEYYKKLGYEVPYVKDVNNEMRVPRNTTILVSINHLPLKSGMYVDLICDCCNKAYKLKYQSYNRHNHNGKTYCKNCAPTIFLKGKNNPKYNNDISDEERIQNRDYAEYIDFVKRVLNRDDYTCRCCKKKSKTLEVHHLDGYNWCIDKRTDDTNGITLCDKCHKSFHLIYGYGGNTKQQFYEWFGKTVQLVKNNIELETNRKVYCYENNAVYNSARECAKKLGVTRTCVYDALAGKTVLANKNHIIWYDKYVEMTTDEKEEWSKMVSKGRKIICITTSEVFVRVIDVYKKYNIAKTTMNRCLKKQSLSAGKLPDGTKLQWMYYDDFLKLSIEKQNEILNRKDGK